MMVYAQTLARSFHKVEASIEIDNNNKTALYIMRALGATKRSKFIDVHHHYIKDASRETQITIKHTRSQQLRADLFTKPLDTEAIRNATHDDRCWANPAY